MPDDLSIMAWLRANADGLISGFAEATTAVVESTRVMGDSIKALGETAEAVEGIFTGFGAVLVGGFIAEKIKGIATAAEEYSEQIHQMEARTGLTGVALQQLKYAADVTGVSFEGLTRLFRGMQMHVATLAAAGAGGATQMRTAMNALGISVKDLQAGMPALLKVADDLHESFGKGAKYTTELGEAQKVFGFGITRMAPMLVEGSAKLKQMAEQANELGLVLTDSQRKAAEEVQHHIKTMSAAWEGAEIQLSEAFIPVVDLVTLTLTKLAKEVKDMAASGELKEWIRIAIDAFFDFAEAVVKAFEKVGEALAEFKVILDDLAATLVVLQHPIDSLIDKLASLGAFGVETTTTFKAAASATDPYIASLEKIKKQLEETSAETEAYQTLLGIFPTIGGPAPLPTPVAKPGEQAKEESERAKAQEAALGAAKAYWAARLELGEVGKAEELRQLQTIADQTYEIQRASLERQLTIFREMPKERDAILAQISELESKHAAEIITNAASIAKSEKDAADTRAKTANDLAVTRLTAENKFTSDLATLQDASSAQLLEISQAGDEAIYAQKRAFISDQQAKITDESTKQWQDLNTQLLKLDADQYAKRLENAGKFLLEQKKLGDEMQKTVTDALSPIVDTFEKVMETSMEHVRRKSREIKKELAELGLELLKSGIKELLLGGGKETIGGKIFGEKGLVGMAMDATGMTKTMEEVWKNTTPFIQTAFEKAWEGIQSIISGIFGTALRGAGSAAGSAMSGAGSDLVGAAGKAGAGALGSATGLTAALQSAWTASTSVISGVFRSAFTGIQSVINSVFGTALGTAASSAGTALAGSAASGIAGAASGALGAGGAGAASAIGPIVGAITAQTVSQTGTQGAMLAQLLLMNVALEAIATREYMPRISETLGVIGILPTSLTTVTAERGAVLPSTYSLGILHPREMVLPSEIAGGMQNIIRTGKVSGGDGGTNVTIHHTVNALDSTSFTDRIDEHKAAIADAWVGAMRGGHPGLSRTAARGRA